MALAASMATRGHGRRAPAHSLLLRRIGAAIGLLAVLALLLGGYEQLTADAPAVLDGVYQRLALAPGCTARFPPKYVRLVRSCLQTAPQDRPAMPQARDVLQETARFEEEQFQAAIRRFSAVIEPMIIVVVGSVVGFVYIAFFVALFAALSTYTAGFIAEVVRGGILSVRQGQIDAARALGLPPGRIVRLVVIPQAMPVIIPPITSQYLNLIKNSSFGAAIAYPDIVAVFMGSALVATGQSIEIIAITLAIYLTLSLAVSLFMNWYNARHRLVTR